MSDSALTIGRRRFWRAASCAALLAITSGLVALAGCPNNGDGDIDDDIVAGVQQRVTAALGGTVANNRGIQLQIPAGALASDTLITMTQVSNVDLAGLDESLIAGVVLEPEGLTFSQPVTLRIPLPEAWPEGSAPLELRFKGTDPAGAVETGATAELSADRRTAIFQISHFSGLICAKQCHAGVREYLAARFAERGCERTAWATRVTGKYPGVVPRDTCESISTDEFNGTIDSFFDDLGGFAPGVDVPADLLANLQQWAEAGRNVVITFAISGTMARGGPHNFCGGVAHSCILEKKDGIWQMRHTFIPNNPNFLALIGGTNLFWWPLSDLNGFRRQLAGVGVERQYCGTPGCFGSDDPFNVLTPYDTLDKRIVPYGACRIFVEREQNSPCHRLAGAWEFTYTRDSAPTTLLLTLTPDGKVDSLWFKAAEASDDPPIAQDAYGEVFRFSRANIATLKARNVEQIVAPTSDQSEFTLAMSLELTDTDSEGREVSSDFFFAINSATMSKDRPEELFEGDYVQTVINHTFDAEGNPVTSTDNFTARVTGRRVPAPNLTEGTGVAQEVVMKDFVFSFTLCGSGSLMFAPLTVLGLCGMRRRYRGCV